ncbi:hypothetical protein N7533_004916 [Penicillium manginii]|uniref:uncharacterized protein n=1 Tax=Penicillium manginii TaxID=203109 RepID=UPI00254682CF|nr:uncharacterized protein N7533_004916 [Penicillium manginii]KAJ5755373.1 hypothetical protein N7533_004916 [Penicillium manginii]
MANQSRVALLLLLLLLFLPVQWGFVRLAAFLLIIEKIGRFLVWLNDEEDSSCDDGSLGTWEGFLEVDSKGFKAIGRGFILTWSCVVSGVAGWREQSRTDTSENQTDRTGRYELTLCVIV